MQMTWNGTGMDECREMNRRFQETDRDENNDGEVKGSDECNENDSEEVKGSEEYKEDEPEVAVEVKSSYLCVCAIHMGVSMTTCAVSFICDPMKGSIICWQDVAEKCPTTVLIKPDGKSVEAYGFEAEQFYREKFEQNEHFYFFPRFKNFLHRPLEGRLGLGIEINDENGRSLPALDVISMAINYVKDKMINSMNMMNIGLEEHEIKWVLTVPAIWTDGAENFMFNAAIKAGIKSARLMIAVEPEAALMLLKHLPVKHVVENSVKTGLEIGARYLVLDADDTIVVTIHEVEEGFRLKEVHSACGGPWGGTHVDRAFEKFLIDVFGGDVIRTVQENDWDDWLDLLRSFEVKRKTLDQSEIVTMTIPGSIQEIYRDVMKTQFSEGINNGRYRSKIHAIRDKLKIQADLIRELCNEHITKTIQLLRNVLQMNSFSTILMVGGFSETKLFQNAVKRTFANLNIVTPTEASHAVVKGALIYGHTEPDKSKRQRVPVVPSFSKK